MKILFTSVGRRVELMQAFCKAADELNVDLTIVGADIVTDAPALQFCDETKITQDDRGEYSSKYDKHFLIIAKWNVATFEEVAA